MVTRVIWCEVDDRSSRRGGETRYVRGMVDTRPLGEVKAADLEISTPLVSCYELSPGLIPITW